MLSQKEFIQMSLELNLFFGRIMKEHMILMEIAFLLKDSNYILEADNLKVSFEEILKETVDLSQGVISKEAIDSNEFVTPYTLAAESKVEFLSGACINKNITRAQLGLKPNKDSDLSPGLKGCVFDLNNRIINLLIDIIKFKEEILNQVLNCKLLTSIYPEMLDHLLREAKFYLEMLLDLQEQTKPKKDILEKEIFWNHIMEEHALFIRGYLDPAEEQLIKTANDFAKTFEKLLKKTEEADKEDICKVTKKNLEATKEIKEFKSNSTKGLLDCEIRAIMTPLLADHVLREANRYIRILKEYLRKC
ncbi:DUF2935 domain-containing protein [Schnuerera sp. xch1]|uniref:DUF2935 domain-containing protein n=1 Tax=Schnuerera sp. xch1 TaxID=2874283 RepID=UPI001CBAA956|nr:DUF2935 domain-containing protein [Schnuerera sp. xch1]MBZ2175510.1 DUF2935 domain-containing protein [Schnuerera sp. xch1]